MPRWLIIILAIVALQVIYTVLACVVFRDKTGTARLNRREISNRKALLRYWIICASASVLPYRAREVFLLLVHFLIHSVKDNLILFSAWLSRWVIWGALAIVYFIGFPMALLAKRGAKESGGFVKYAGLESSITRRF